MATWTTKKSGYLAAAAAVTWTSGGPNSLASNTYSGLSDELDNSATRYTHADLYLELGSAAFTGTGSGIEIFLIPCVDGTNYPTWTGGGNADKQENAPHFVGFASLTGTTAAQKISLLNIELPSGKYKYAIRNKGGVALAASGNTLYWRPHGYVSTDV